MIRLATVVETLPRVKVSWSGGTVPLRSSDTLASLANGEKVLVAEVNGDWYAIERVGT